MLTALGIVLGVAMLFGVLVSNATTQAGVDELIADFTGRSDIIVSAPGAFNATIPAAEAQRLRALPEVVAAVGILSTRSGVRTPAVVKRVDISLRGVDLKEERAIHAYPLKRGAFFRPGREEAVVPQRLLSKLGLKVGDEISVATSSGTRPLRITGALADTGAGRTNQGDVVFTSIETARAFAGKADAVSSVRLVLREGTNVEAWIARNREAIGEGLEVRNAETLAEGFKDFLGILGTVFAFFAAIVLFVGAFLIYLTLSMAVIERVKIYGTMRALGATRRQIRRVVVAEAATLGVVSTAIGLLVGLLIAKGLIALLSALFEIDLPGLTVSPGALSTGIVVGIFTTVISALVPARRAARLSPVVAMKGDYASETKLSRAWRFGVVSAIAGIALSMTSLGSIGTPLLLLGSVLLVPVLLRPLARGLGRITNRLARGVGDVAVLHLVKERSRSAYTLALIMVVMAMLFSIGGLNVSMARALDETLDRQFGSDLHIDAAGALDERIFLRDLRTIAGVGDITAIRYAMVSILDDQGDDGEQFVRIIDPSTYFSVESFQFARGTQADARRGLERGEILIPQGLATSLRKTVGDTLRLRTARGVQDLRIAATYESFTGPPEITMGLPPARALLNAGDANEFHVNVTQATTPVAVKQEVERRLGERYALDIETSQGTKEIARKEFGQFFMIFYAILGVAGIVGLLGLANTLAMSVLQRYREIGVLRAIGATRRQVRRMVLVESATLGIVAFALSLPLGLLLSMLTVRSVSNAFGFTVSYLYPALWVPFVAVFGLFVAIVAALAPGRRAARLDVVKALQFE